jgi:group I intron endonuclease
MQLDKNITKEAGIYRILNTVNGKFYIGSSVNIRERCYRHLSGLRKNTHDNTYLQKAFNKYTEEAFVFEVLEIIPKEEFIDNKYLIDIEQLWLDTYMTYLRSNGYNICQFAQSWQGNKHSVETIQKLKNRVVTEEHRKNISLSKKGIKNPKTALSNSDYHEFYDPEGNLHQFYNLKQFCRDKKLEQAAMQRVEKQKQTNHKGWTTKETRQQYLDYIAKYPLPPFYVISPEGIEYEVWSPANFAKEHGLFQSAFDRLIRNKQSHHRNWKVKS